MENPKERIEDILKRNPYLDAKESFFASIKLYFGRKVYKKAKRGTIHIVFLSFRIHHIMLILKC